ncbi:MAG: hypothetical protein JST00_30710 [Deltaproteobacteria bacterium]|nr:hypothetical protein [Deltaproteobacteria bacterium]
MSALFIALAIGAGFLLGLRVGIALGHRNARKRLEAEREGRKRGSSKS